MRKSNIFVGFFLISIGFINLIHNYLYSIDFYYIRYIWQIVLIIIGISFLHLSDKLKIILIIISAFLLAYCIYGFIANFNLVFDIRNSYSISFNRINY